MPTIYDLNWLRENKVPDECLKDWMKCVTNDDLKETYWSTRNFIDTYGAKIFWLFKDQQMLQKDGTVLNFSQKQTYILNMIASEDDFR